MAHLGRVAPLTGLRTCPLESEFASLNFTRIYAYEADEIHGPMAWVEFTTPAQAEFVSRASRTSLHAQFNAEREQNKGRRSPHRWFMLAAFVKGRVRGEVVMAAPGPGARLRTTTRHLAPLHVVAFDNKNPYPDWAFEIDLLSRTTGIPMRPNYAGTPVMTNAARLVQLLDAYGATRFRGRWLSPDSVNGADCLGVESEIIEAKIGWCADTEDGWGAVTSACTFAAYGQAEFGAEWQPDKADAALGKERADDLRSLLDWVNSRKVNLPDDALPPSTPPGPL